MGVPSGYNDENINTGLEYHLTVMYMPAHAVGVPSGGNEGQHHHRRCVCFDSNVLSITVGVTTVHHYCPQYIIAPTNKISWLTHCQQHLYFLEHHQDKYPYKTIATYIVLNHSDITSKSNHSEYIVFRTQIDVQNETDIPRSGTVAP
jgi:hypothetical protein